MRKLAVVIVAACVSFAAQAHAQEIERFEGVGPFQFGMSTDVLRPLATETGPTESNGRKFVARNPAEFAGASFQAVLTISPLDVLDQIDLKHQSRMSPRQCNALHAQVIAALEPRYGALGPSSYRMRVTNEGPPQPESVGARSRRGIYRQYGGDEASSVNAQNVYAIYQAQGGNCVVDVQLRPWRKLHFQPLPAPSAEELEARQLILGHRWRVRPSRAIMQDAYPKRAMERARTGSAQLECLVGAGGVLSCAVLSEDPPGWGFGEAARLVMANSRVEEVAADGSSIVGSRVRTRVAFEL